MAADKTEIFNLALSEVGSRASVASPSEASREAEVCTLWFQPVVDLVLRAAPWPCATGVRRLGLIKERDAAELWVSTDPDPGWQYVYSAPSDMIRPRHLSTFERFSVSVMGDKSAIMCNTYQAILTYTLRQDNLSIWDSGLKMAVALALGAHIAMPLTGKPTRAQRCADAANTMIEEARTSAANSEETQYESMPEWFTARGFAGTTLPSRYIYPYGPLLQGVDGVQ